MKQMMVHRAFMTVNAKNNCTHPKPSYMHDGTTIFDVYNGVLSWCCTDVVLTLYFLIKIEKANLQLSYMFVYVRYQRTCKSLTFVPSCVYDGYRLKHMLVAGSTV